MNYDASQGLLLCKSLELTSPQCNLQSGVGIESLTFEFEIEEPNPLAITACTARTDVSDTLKN